MWQQPLAHGLAPCPELGDPWHRVTMTEVGDTKPRQGQGTLRFAEKGSRQGNDAASHHHRGAGARSMGFGCTTPTPPAKGKSRQGLRLGNPCLTPSRLSQGATAPAAGSDGHREQLLNLGESLGTLGSFWQLLGLAAGGAHTTHTERDMRSVYFPLAHLHCEQPEGSGSSCCCHVHVSVVCPWSKLPAVYTCAYIFTHTCQQHVYTP